MHLIMKSLLCGMGITTAEFLCGLLVNTVMGLHVWDYSGVPYNVMGQVCLPYTLVWCALSVPAMGVDRICCRYAWNWEGEGAAEVPQPPQTVSVSH